MPSGVYRESQQIFRRKQGDGELEVFISGPFIEVFLNKVFIGKVRILSAVTMPEGFDELGDECIRLPNYTVLLTVEEQMDIVTQRMLAAERRAGTN